MLLASRWFWQSFVIGVGGDRESRRVVSLACRCSGGVEVFFLFGNVHTCESNLEANHSLRCDSRLATLISARCYPIANNYNLSASECTQTEG